MTHTPPPMGALPFPPRAPQHHAFNDLNGPNKTHRWRLGVCIALLLINPWRGAQATESGGDVTAGSLGEIVVTAGLRDQPLEQINASTTVIDATTVHQSQAVHFEELLGQLPNVNWAGDTQRPRYFQIRGLGELEEYQGAPNPSVGVLIDDMDFSSIGGVASLIDVDQVDVLRGPQGTAFGANALAGLIYLTSHAPTPDLEAAAGAAVGNENTHIERGILNLPTSALPGGVRLAMERLDTDGAYHNAYLNRNDTNGRHDTTARLAAQFTLSPNVELAAHWLHAQFNDGYDAWSPEGGRTTHSDQPGVDQQTSDGYSLKLNARLDERNHLSVLNSAVVSRLVYSYDGDWGNATYWAPYTDQFSETQRRERRSESTDVRWSNDRSAQQGWRLGLFHQTLRESLNDLSVGMSADPINGPYQQNLQTLSVFDSQSTALYGQIDQPLQRGSLSVGLRAEHHQASYQDHVNDAIADELTSHQFKPVDHLWGGHLSLTEPLRTFAIGSTEFPDGHVNLTLARGYKASGFNLSNGLPDNALTYKAESDLNVEAGIDLRSRDHRLQWKADLFRMTRQDAQIKTSYQSDPTNPNTFVFYTGNAANAWHQGLESELTVRWSDTLSSLWRMGLLKTQFTHFTTLGDAQQIESRELAHAPHVSGSLALTYAPNAANFLRIEWSGMSGYYYDLPPNESRSQAYVLTHLSLGKKWHDWEATLGIHNVFNQNYTVRGFYFGLVPPDYNPTAYTQLGEPRLIRLDLNYHFNSPRGP